VWTATGPVDVAELGTTLTHEHVLVDFVGADKVGRHRYDADEAFRAALPHLQALKARGCRTLVECTPAYLGRDPVLLRRLSQASGLQILTNTGYYGAAQDKFVPAHAYDETAAQLEARWTAEWRDGIKGTGIRPAFMKIGVDAGPLSPIDRKLVTAGTLCHRETGLRLHVHTGDGVAAQAIVDLLRAERVPPDAYVWVHAQSEKDRAVHRRLAAAGAWVSLDGVSEASLETHVGAVVDLARAGHLGRVLVSQDAGWYHVGEPGGGRFRPYTFLFDTFLPALRKAGLTEADTRRLMVDNPARALTGARP
jgi:phosphotriesterase-related protein